MKIVRGSMVLGAIFIILYLWCTLGEQRSHCVSTPTPFLPTGIPMNFAQVANTFEHIYQVSSRTQITQLLAQLFDTASAQESNIIANLSLGILRPPYLGTQFNLAEKNIIVLLARLLDLPEKDIKKRAQELGDLGAVLDGWAHKPEQKLTVLHVYERLEALEKIGGVGSQEEKLEQLLDLLKALDPLSAKYCVRIILGTLRLGFSDMTIIDALSWMEQGDKSLRGRIERAYNTCADIGLIAQTLKEDGMAAIDDMHVRVGVPIRPAAAERLPSAQAIVEKIGPCIAQPKLDGFRLQIHIDKRGETSRIEFYSRNLADMSYMFPDLVKALENLPVTTCVMEGEAIAYDPHTDIFLPFQETVKRRRKHGIESAMVEFPLRLYIFDLLYLDGTNYMPLTHKQRRTELQRLFDHYNNSQVKLIEEKRVTTARELEDYFAKNIADGLEGLVVKKEDSAYQPGKRNFNWIKLKRQEEGQLEDTVDCVIVGYYAGSGKRAAFGIGAFLVAVFNKKKDCFQTIAKIGTGLTDDGWKKIKKECDAHAVQKQPINVEVAKELVPDVWVASEIVCVIRADEITLSPLHTAGKTEDKPGYALRFPRFIDYRLDKSPEQATDVEEIAHMYRDQFVAQK